jgi:putative ubiquitin-RnfH superfamily antitoxin RatB of RatAB toxin-antitoxin module
VRVAIVVATAGRQDVVEIDLAEGSSVSDALARVRAHPAFAAVDWERLRVGIWSRGCAPDTKLREGDRIELYRPLVADPKAQRRSRARVKPSTRSRSGP